MLTASSTDGCAAAPYLPAPYPTSWPTLAGRAKSLTGIRAVAALLVLATHAAYGTGKETHGYIGLLYSRLEIGVPIFFVLSGFLLFGPWVRAAANGFMPPPVGRYAVRRIRRIMPAYVLTVLLIYLLYQVHPAHPNPGHTWTGLFRYLTLTQIYTDDYISTYLHQGMTQMWSLAVEVAFYMALPVLAHLLLVVLCRRRWRPGLLLAGLAALAAISPIWLIVLYTTHWLPSAAGMWLPAYLACFAGGMLLAVLRATGVRCHAFAVIPVALISYLIVSTPIGGDVTTSPVKLWEPLAKAGFYAIIATLAVAPLALGDRGWYERLLSSGPMVALGEISYEVFLIHVAVMAIATGAVLRWPVFTGSLTELFAVTLVLTIPPAWLLHRVTHGQKSATPSRENSAEDDAELESLRLPSASQALELAVASFERTSTSGALGSCGCGMAAREKSAIAPGRKTTQ
ncbi:MAG: acyltransferase [Mycobacteriaceae bacterium]|nr:acyltransferase [Mycobacteriaceae bacterium]